jgi:SAM-dependent methyltransferase
LNNGIPILLRDEFFDAESVEFDWAVNLVDHLNWKKMQIQYHHQENIDTETREFELRRPFGENRLFETLVEYDLELARRIYPGEFRGKSILSLCCGRGMDAEFFWRMGAVVAGTDIVPSCLEIARERMRRAGGTIETFCCDVEDLPVKDGTFDICVVNDGLHHLPKPYAAVAEMARIAREGMIIIEPSDSPILALARYLGVSRDVEASGNYKTYFDARELEHELRNLGFTRVRTDYSFYKKAHRPPRIYNVLSREPFFSMVKGSLVVARKALGSWSNHLVVVARR